MADPFIAEIRIWGCNFAPRGWTLCNGQLLQIAQNTAVFSLVGTTYGGDGRTTCGVPNLQGRVPAHAGRGPGLTPRALGEKGGSSNVYLTQSTIPSHSHFLEASTSNDQALPGGNSLGKRTYYQTNTTANLVDLAAGVMSSTGGSKLHTNLQPYQVLNFCFALQGLYPSRS